jgi:hypothetical protein
VFRISCFVFRVSYFFLQLFLLRFVLRQLDHFAHERVVASQPGGYAAEDQDGGGPAQPALAEERFQESRVACTATPYS